MPPPADLWDIRTQERLSPNKLASVGLACGMSVALFGADPPQRASTVIHSEVRSGKLVAPVVVASKSIPEIVVGPARSALAAPTAKSNAASGIDQAVQQIAAEHALSADLVHSMIKVESNYNARAVSPKGARGLMQLVPSTARRFGVSDAFNPRENIDGGVKYLRYLLDLYGGNYPLALAAYNAGEGAVARFGGVPPFHETQNYLIQLWKQLEKSRKTVSPQKEGEPK
jgi:soluble lytic murein transglycosylase-like protein